MSQTYWTLAETLRKHGQKVPALIQVCGLSKNTVYDIVNGKSQAITLETVDKILTGLERLTGMRFTVEDILKREPPQDTYAHLFAHAALYDPMEARKLFFLWTPTEKAKDARYWEDVNSAFCQTPLTSVPNDAEDFEDYLDSFLEEEA